MKYILVIIFSTIDAVATGLLLADHGLDFEANPIMLVVYSTVGLVAGGIVKLMMTIAGVTLLYYCSTIEEYKQSTSKVMSFLVGFYLLIMCFHIITWVF